MVFTLVLNIAKYINHKYSRVLTLFSKIPYSNSMLINPSLNPYKPYNPYNVVPTIDFHRFMSRLSQIKFAQVISRKLIT